MLLDLNAPPVGGPSLCAYANGSRDPVLYREQSSTGEFAIKVVRDDRDRQAAEEIINRLYGWRGYGEHHHLSEQKTCTTFIASRDDEVLGTLTLTVDSAKGLGVDATFADELYDLRATCDTSLCELTKFAFDPSPASQPMLAAMFHVIFVYGTQLYDCTDLLIEVNPRHVRFYQVMLGFERLGTLRTNTAVQAPSQLMRLAITDIERNIDRLAGRETVARHSLYPHFLCKDDEQALRRRIASSADRAIVAQHRSQRRIDRSNRPDWRDLYTGFSPLQERAAA